MIILILISFRSGLSTTIGVFVGFIVLCVLLFFVCAYTYGKHNHPKMQIFRGEELIKDTYEPYGKNLMKCLESMHDDDKLVITERNPKYDHPFGHLFTNHSWELDESTKLVGYELNGEIYFTINESTNNRFHVRQTLGSYLKSLSNEERQVIIEKTWWKMTQGRDLKTADMVYNITRTKLVHRNSWQQHAPKTSLEFFLTNTHLKKFQPVFRLEFYFQNKFLYKKLSTKSTPS